MKLTDAYALARRADLMMPGHWCTARALTVLFKLAEQWPRPVSFGEIIKLVDWPKPALSRALDSLCARELVVRVRNEADKRGVLLMLTAAGRDMAVKIAGADSADDRVVCLGDPSKSDGVVETLDGKRFVIVGADAGAKGEGNQ